MRAGADWKFITAICGVCLGLLPGWGCRREATAPSVEKPVITFWTTEGYQQAIVDELELQAREFEAKYAARVKIEYFSWEEINSKYLAALAAGRPPDIGQHGPDLPLRFGADGSVLPVDRIIEDLGRERFYPEFLDAVCRYQDHYWSVPWYIEVRPLLVRQDWLAELNLAPPTTWDEWLSMCRAMTRDVNGDGTIDRWGFGLYGQDRFGQAWVALAAANGGGLFATDGRITVDTPENIEALQWYADLFLVHQVTPPGTRSAQWTDMNAYFASGTVGSLLINGYLLERLRQESPNLLASARFVPVPARRAGERSRSFLGGSHLMLFADSRNTELAAAFVRFLLERENYLRFLQAVPGGPLPVLRDIGADAYFQEDPNRRVLIAQIDGAVRLGYRGPPRPEVGAVEGEGVFGEALAEVLSGRKSAAEALRAAQQRTEAIFAAQGAGAAP